MNAKTPILITYQGQTHKVNTWSELTGIPHQILRQRLQNGDKPEDILSPCPWNETTITYQNKTKTCAEWAKSLKISESLLQRRIEDGWLPEFAFQNLTDEALAKEETEKLKSVYYSPVLIDDWDAEDALEPFDFTARNPVHPTLEQIKLNRLLGNSKSFGQKNEDLIYVGRLSLQSWTNVLDQKENELAHKYALLTCKPPLPNFRNMLF